jgi:hypothetical protein
MRAQMWMSTGRYGAFIPCPAIPLERAHSSNAVHTDLLDGGVHIQPKSGHARRYAISWKANFDDAQVIQSFYDGLYGDGPFYLIDPSVTRNLLPPQWAAPALSIDRWPSLIRKVKATRIVNPVNQHQFSAFGAVYPIPAATPIFGPRTPRVTIPIPPGSTLRLRAWGSSTGSAAIRVNAYDLTTGALTVLNLMPSADGSLLTLSGPEFTGTPALYPSNTLFPAQTLYPADAVTVPYTGPFYSHVELWLGKLTGVDSSLTLNGLTAQLNTTHTTWYPGQGTNGLEFDGELTDSVYRTWGEGWKNLQAPMTEVGTWLR